MFLLFPMETYGKRHFSPETGGPEKAIRILKLTGPFAGIQPGCEPHHEHAHPGVERRFTTLSTCYNIHNVVRMWGIHSLTSADMLDPVPFITRLWLRHIHNPPGLIRESKQDYGITRSHKGLLYGALQFPFLGLNPWRHLSIHTHSEVGVSLNMNSFSPRGNKTSYGTGRMNWIPVHRESKNINSCLFINRCL